MVCGETVMKRCLLFFFLAAAVLPCGVERNAVKTSADKDAGRVDFNPVTVSIAALNALQAPTRDQLNAHPDTRFLAELKTYTVTGYLVGFKLEADEDFHIVVEDPDSPGTTMVVEMVSGNCVPLGVVELATKLRASWETRFGKAGKRFKKLTRHTVKVQITGVGFFDFLHGQTGVAKNGFELHRVIDWKELPNITAVFF